jgi:hypothetical protein
MIDSTWETDDASLAITVRWGDVALHTAHLAPPRSFFLGDSTADCVLPDSAVGRGRAPLVLAERGAVYLVLHPSMDPEGTITAPGKRARTVGDLARPGMAEACSDVPGAFLVELAKGAVACLSIGDFAITITLETKAARAVDRDLGPGRRVVPLHLGSAALHLAALGVAWFVTPPITDPREYPSDEQIYFIQQALQRADEKEEAAIAEEEGDVLELGDARSASDRGPIAALFQQRGRYASASLLDSMVYVDGPGSSLSGSTDPGRARRHLALAANAAVDEGNVNDTIDPRDDGYSMLPLDADLTPYAATRRSLSHAEIPDPSSIRPEAFFNSFDYVYPGPAREGAAPFIVHLGAAPSPYAAGHHLLRVGVQGRRSADGTREIIARDARIQVEFNPRAVRSYRLLGNENVVGGDPGDRYAIPDAGKFPAGHSVTAVYDVVLRTTVSSPVTVRLRWRPQFATSRPEESVFTMAPRDIAASLDKAPQNLRLAVALAGFAEILRKDPHARAWRLDDVERVAAAAVGIDAREQELLSLIRTARSLDEPRPESQRRARAGDASLMGF